MRQRLSTISFAILIVVMGCAEARELPDASIDATVIDAFPADAAVDGAIADGAGVDSAIWDARQIDGSLGCDSSMALRDTGPARTGSVCADEGSASILLSSRLGPEGDQTAFEVAATCAADCLCDPDMEECTLGCLDAAIGFGTDCGRCMSRLFVCAAARCRTDCFPTDDAVRCGRCVEATGCWEEARACGGGYLGELP